MAHVARKRFGQHFLIDGALIDAIVGAIHPRSGEALVEIGPGLGALTWPLVEACERLTVIELDRDLAHRLRRRSELEVIEADVLTVDFGALARARG
ncbi:MAG: rRNA adenine N-6-methyltransferase family protein, partial [Burkholderiaceae bacterium]